MSVPRLVVAGVASGVGKTTLMLGLVRALRARGLAVAVFKCGPDYLDPTHHAVAAGRPSHNLDGWMMGEDAVRATFARASRDADVAVIEGMMGLFDGFSPAANAGSTAEIAAWLEAPVVLVADASGVARSIAPLARGFADFDPAVRVAALACNRIGGRAHLDLLRRALTAPPIVGGLPVRDDVCLPERHLGLVTAAAGGIAEAKLDALGEHVERWIDLDAVLAIARAAPPLPAPRAPAPSVAAERCRIGLAFDEGFHFYYEDNLARLEALGARLVRFSPVHDTALPDVDALYLGGGYPEVHAEALARNRSMRDAIAAFAAAGGPIYAECGGLMLLARAIRTGDGVSHPMVGIVPGEAVMHGSLQALGYVEVATTRATILGPSGTRFRGHEFRHSELVLDRPVEPIYALRRRPGMPETRDGIAREGVVASYVHAHWASNPAIAESIVAAAAARAGRFRA